MMSSIPVVDLNDANSGPRLVDALSSASSALLVGHGIDPALRREVVDQSRRFFLLPRKEKAKVQWPGTGPWFGWQPVNEGQAELTGTRVPDLVERFEVREVDTFALWPEITGFREAWTAYYRSCFGLASSLITILAAELDLPAEDVPGWTAGQFANLVANYYPPQIEPPLPGQTRVGSHTDRGGITLLSADEAPGGLEVRVGGQEWVPVVIPEEAYVIQTGDLFACWTNRQIPANIHRVVNPPRAVAASASRLALVYFHYPSLDTLVSPAPSCVHEGKPPVTPVVCGDHIMHRQELFKKSPDEVIVLT